MSLFVLLGLALRVEGLEAQPVQTRTPKAASDLAGRRLCPNGMDFASCFQYTSGGAIAAKARKISDSSTMGEIPLAFDRLLNSIETKRPKVGRWDHGNDRPVLSLPCQTIATIWQSVAILRVVLN